jgi:hypothetical protein
VLPRVNRHRSEHRRALTPRSFPPLDLTFTSARRCHQQRQHAAIDSHWPGRPAPSRLRLSRDDIAAETAKLTSSRGIELVFHATYGEAGFLDAAKTAAARHNRPGGTGRVHQRQLRLRRICLLVFRKGLGKAGYAAGQNATIEYHCVDRQGLSTLVPVASLSLRRQAAKRASWLRRDDFVFRLAENQAFATCRANIAQFALVVSCHNGVIPPQHQAVPILS